MSNATDRLRQALDPMSLDIHEPEPIVAVRRDELRAMLDVIDAAEEVLANPYGNTSTSPLAKLQVAVGNFKWLQTDEIR